MGIETTLADRKGKEFCELPKVTNSNSKSRKNRRRHKKMSSVQRLFETCKEVFASSGPGIIPPPHDIQRLRSVLGMIPNSNLSIMIVLLNVDSVSGFDVLRKNLNFFLFGLSLCGYKF